MLNAHTPTTPGKFFAGTQPSPLGADKRNRNLIIKKIDIAITERVDEALWNDEVVRNMDYKELDVYVEDQVVYLHGYLVSASNQQRIETALQTIPDILSVKNSLILDDNLTREVAGALGPIEHDANVKFFTGVRHGVVTLNGEVTDKTLRTRAETCVAGVPGVRGVLNHIRAPGVVPKPEDLRFLQPTIGAQIYFRDDPSGIVKHVIINPNNRLVIAMVVQGNFSQLPQLFRAVTDKSTLSSKKIVIPIREIRFLTKRSGFLEIKSVETTRYAEYDGRKFISPKNNWHPPFPYDLEDVLFPVAYGEIMHGEEDETFSESQDVPLEPSFVQDQVIPA